MKVDVKKAEPRTSLFLRGILVKTKENLDKLKKERGYRTFNEMFDALFKDV